MASMTAEEVGDRWGTADREREFYPVIQVPIPKDLVIEAGAFEQLPDGRIAIGTRRGDIFLFRGSMTSGQSQSMKFLQPGLMRFLACHGKMMRFT